MLQLHCEIGGHTSELIQLVHTNIHKQVNMLRLYKERTIVPLLGHHGPAAVEQWPPLLAVLGPT